MNQGGQNFEVLGQVRDVALLVDRLHREETLWDEIDARQRQAGSPHSESKCIVLRWAADRSVEAAFNEIEAVDYPAAQRLMPYAGRVIDDLLALIPDAGALGRVILTQLPPGAKVAPHLDEGPYADLYDRFHVCIQGDSGNKYHCGGEAHYPKPGEAFWFNHKREHWVENKGALTRIHLIVDVIAPAFTAKRGTYYQAEDIFDIEDEMQELLRGNWEEIAHYKDIPLGYDRQAYQVANAAGHVRCYTARDRGELVGYAIFFVRLNMHYKSSLQAHQDVFFVRASHRKGMTGVRLIRLAEQRLCAEGVQVVYHHAKLTNRLGELLNRLGYELVDQIYAKRLD